MPRDIAASTRYPKPIVAQYARVNKQNRSPRGVGCVGTFIESSLNEAYAFEYTLRASINVCSDDSFLIRHNPNSCGSVVSRRHYGNLSGFGKHVQDEVIGAHLCKHEQRFAPLRSEAHG